MSLAGWFGGVLRAVKLLYSFSTSGPSATLKPISENIDDISSITWDTGWIFPFLNERSGRVTSILSFSNFLLISFISIFFDTWLSFSCKKFLSSFILKWL